MSNRAVKHVAPMAGLALAAIAMAGPAAADPINFIPGGDEISIKFVNRENVVTAPGQELFGILNITQINSSDGLTTYWNGNGGTDGTQLVGYFELLTATADQTGGAGLTFVGGRGALYNVPTGTYSPNTSPNAKDFVNQLCGGSAVCFANPWLTFDFVPGINDLFGPAANGSIQAALATTNVQAGFGYLSVTGGTNAAKFDTNSYTFTNFAPADMFFRSNFVLANDQTCSNSNGWAVCSDDPIEALTVPEPETLALLATGLVAAGFSFRRRKAGA